MDLLNLFAGCSLFVTAHCSAPQPKIAQAASTFALPEAWVRAVLLRESGGRTSLGGRPITSSAGAMGLMQLMPRTYDDLRRQLGLGADPYTPHDNILAGTAYLQQMYRRYGYPGMFAAYNAGPGRFDDFLLRQRPLPGETLAYVAAIAPGAEAAFTGGNPASKPVAARTSGAPKSAKFDTLFFGAGGANSLFVMLSAPLPSKD
jgi:soluble lytic murein transglycosylase-like protein